MALLDVQDLHVTIGAAQILRGVSFALEPRQTLGVVGESGCGKSMTGLAIMGMLPPKGSVSRGSICLAGKRLESLTQREWLQVRGQDIAMIMQDPFTSLNPMMRVGAQIAEVLTLHRGVSMREANAQAVRLLDEVGVPGPESAAQKYPHQMSGGQRQRVVIAIAFACQPKLLIADEPTTALDVTLQAQILRLLKALQESVGTAVILISHDIGVIGSVADIVAVYYAGRVVEFGPTTRVLECPSHPYTQALMNALPAIGKSRLESISGQPPDLSNLPQGCSFRPRCPFAFVPCTEDPPAFLVSPGHSAACWLQDPALPRVEAVPSTGNQ